MKPVKKFYSLVNMDFKNLLRIYALISVACLSSALTPSTYLNDADILRLKKAFASAFPASDLISAHYAVLGYSLLGEKLPEDPCKFFESKVDKRRLDTVFHASSGAKLLTNCKLPTTGLQQALDSAITNDASMQDIYYSVMSLKNLKLKIDTAKVTKTVTASLKRDDSVLNLGYAFHVASALSGDVTSFFERIEDAIVQADEVDGKFLHFEGGLGITATIMSGIYKLAEVAKKSPALTTEQSLKFTNYFLSRKFVQSVKGSAQMLEIMKIYAMNKFHIPMVVTLTNNAALSTSNPIIQLRISNVLGEALGPLTVTLDSAKIASSEVAHVNKKPFQAVKGSNSLYTFNFMDTKPKRGFYTILINAIPGTGGLKLIGNTGAKVGVKVMTTVKVEDAEIGTSYLDQVSASKITSLTHPKENVNLEADYHQRIYLKFKLVDQAAKTPVLAHQALLQFTNQQSKQEVAFIVQPDSTNVYKLEMDVNNKRKDFADISGVYDMHIIVGDPVIENSFIWKIGQATLSFAQKLTDEKQVNPYEPQPEIKHMFREKEKRPPSVVSNTFSILCLVPLLLLFILWLQLGANLSNMPFSIYVPLFHGGILIIFLLFACFWMHLNMFSTLKYLAALGLVTYLAGHKLLSKLAQPK